MTIDPWILGDRIIKINLLVLIERWCRFNSGKAFKSGFVLILTGMRAAEACSAVVSDGTIHWEQLKKRGAVWKRFCPVPEVFLNKIKSLKPCSVRYLEINFKKCFGITPCQYRHWYATDMLCRGYEWDDVRQALGHVSTITSRIYAGYYNIHDYRVRDIKPEFSSQKCYWWEALDHE